MISTRLKYLSGDYTPDGDKFDVNFSSDYGDDETIDFILDNDYNIHECHVNERVVEPKIIIVGEGNTEREVHHYATKDTSPYLRAGLTIHKGKNTWSSLPHDFEMHPEPGFEEIFFHMIKGGSRRSIQVKRGMNHEGEYIDELVQVFDREFIDVPMGYHPVVGEPDVTVAYLWAYICKKPSWEKI